MYVFSKIGTAILLFSLASLFSVAQENMDYPNLKELLEIKTFNENKDVRNLNKYMESRGYDQIDIWENFITTYSSSINPDLQIAVFTDGTVLFKAKNSPYLKRMVLEEELKARAKGFHWYEKESSIHYLFAQNELFFVYDEQQIFTVTLISLNQLPACFSNHQKD